MRCSGSTCRWRTSPPASTATKVLTPTWPCRPLNSGWRTLCWPGGTRTVARSPRSLASRSSPRSAAPRTQATGSLAFHAAQIHRITHRSRSEPPSRIPPASGRGPRTAPGGSTTAGWDHAPRYNTFTTRTSTPSEVTDWNGHRKPRPTAKPPSTSAPNDPADRWGHPSPISRRTAIGTPGLTSSTTMIVIVPHGIGIRNWCSRLRREDSLSGWRSC